MVVSQNVAPSIVAPVMLALRKRKEMNMAQLEETKFGSILGWSSPFEFVCKLERELERIDNAKTLDELVDHTMNFALTANHIVDWSVGAIAERPGSRLGQDGARKLDYSDWPGAKEEA